MKRRVLILVVILAVPFRNYGQEVISSSGGYGMNDRVSAAWTLGELMTETFVSQNLMLTQGFHQSNLRTTGIPEPVASVPGIAVFPIPADQRLNLSVRTGEFAGLSYRLIDFTGRTLISNTFRSSLENLDVSFLASGNYLVQFTGQDGKIMQNTLIIKQ